MKKSISINSPWHHRAGLFCAGSAAALLALAGCGGVGDTSSTRIRAVDAATNAGTANLLVNSSASYGDQTNFSASSYYYLSSGTSSFSGLANTQSSTPQTATVSGHNLATNQYYTAFLVGRADVAATDKRFLQVHVTSDQKPSSIPSGQAAIRVVDAAPDAGDVDVLVNGAIPDSALKALSFSGPTEPFLLAPYIPVKAGTLNIAVNATGTSTAIVPATNVAVSAGKSYTFIIDEPIGGVAATATEPATQSTYSLQTISEP